MPSRPVSRDSVRMESSWSVRHHLQACDDISAPKCPCLCHVGVASVDGVTYHVAMPTPSMPTERETLERYEKRGGLLRGHFRLTSGLHSDLYLQSALVLQHPEDAGVLGEALAAAFRDDRVQTVLETG